jgi:DNA-binding transcriptional LysR family regulator
MLPRISGGLAVKVRWDDFETVLEVWRAGTQERAAAALGLDQATVSRRIARLEQAADVKLFQRRGGRLVPTTAGEVFVSRLAQVDEAVAAARLALAAANAIAETTVRIASTPLLIDHVLAPALGALPRRFPGLKVDLAPRPAGAVIAADCDLAVRESRPEEDGLVLRRAAIMPFRVYAPAARPDCEEWIGLLPREEPMPHARWMAEHVLRARVAARVAEWSTALVAVARGVGRAPLPVFIGRREPAVLPVSDVVFSQEVWVAHHADAARTPPASAAQRWLDEALSAAHLSEG